MNYPVVNSEHFDINELWRLADDEAALDRIFSLVYEELRRLARLVRQGKGSETLNTTSLVHEAYIKLLPSQHITFQNRKHFFRIAARAMRQVIVNHAKHKMRKKRGEGVASITFDEQIYIPLPVNKVLDFDESLNRLQAIHPRQAQVVEYRFFTGLTTEEIADLLEVAVPTIHRDWRSARAWLASSLKTE